jgi:hypothetical protein
MAKKKVGIFIHDAVSNALDEASVQFAHKKGLCVSAAILMFLESDPKTQRKYVERVAIAELGGGVPSILSDAKAEQARRINSGLG